MQTDAQQRVFALIPLTLILVLGVYVAYTDRYEKNHKGDSCHEFCAGLSIGFLIAYAPDYIKNQ